ncbi:MAG: hypothetical protein GXO35_09590 [Gammaproteobacteria bacterium]|nr:hypothetical protein [Gammaproteobacteria bacterium]
MDHMVFKMDIYKTFMGQASLKATDLSDHYKCRLGHWYYQGEGVACYSKLPGYQEVEGFHVEVHRGGKRALEMLEVGDFASGVEELVKMEEASIGVQDSLEMIATSAEKDLSLLCTAD